ncbi:transmembrane protein, putative (macronuclear) [Tetrahymena thermophila SB210]|uniref:Transmembrane protein, putative n=1 Tax=Tetrahymena thermophila (strain SB210) TaxID=312017 RepID=W7X961_TETTS|nr:transmembrane protein, putative [Tetrahymena thermophila SB210]EWS73877.1 transmembrane protein, putative [Tetrahymena thermophila SB210]|eukprot:XP_012653624.1 transmembrane protein, putative [Tetrahymena thermophila SB210]
MLSACKYEKMLERKISIYNKMEQQQINKVQFQIVLNKINNNNNSSSNNRLMIINMQKVNINKLYISKQNEYIYLLFDYQFYKLLYCQIKTINQQVCRILNIKTINKSHQMEIFYANNYLIQINQQICIFQFYLKHILSDFSHSCLCNLIILFNFFYQFVVLSYLITDFKQQNKWIIFLLEKIRFTQQIYLASIFIQSQIILVIPFSIKINQNIYK